MMPATSTTITEAHAEAGIPSVSFNDAAMVYDCRALKPKPKVTSNRTENSSASQRRLSPRSM
ncbi:hypothetical protein D3C80_807250 [compost metagenome]